MIIAIRRASIAQRATTPAVARGRAATTLAAPGWATAASASDFNGKFSVVDDDVWRGDGRLAGVGGCEGDEAIAE
jgi:hypothetical protein